MDQLILQRTIKGDKIEGIASDTIFLLNLHKFTQRNTGKQYIHLIYLRANFSLNESLQMFWNNIERLDFHSMNSLCITIHIFKVQTTKDFPSASKILNTNKILNIK
jgi:hypothetical protein